MVTGERGLTYILCRGRAGTRVRGGLSLIQPYSFAPSPLLFFVWYVGGAWRDSRRTRRVAAAAGGGRAEGEGSPLTYMWCPPWAAAWLPVGPHCLRASVNLASVNHTEQSESPLDFVHTSSTTNYN